MERGMVSVDRWSEGSQVYFLTHLHADHTHGLSSTWKHAPLFCSRITAKLFPYKFPGFDLSLLRVLEIGRWYSLSLVSPSTGSDTRVDFMPIDANHCPGAVMYLFRGEFGHMLYTGDFRWEQTSERAKIGRSMLLNAIGNNKIDILYLDNTFCHPSYCFPPREVAAQQVVDVIASHPEHDIIIGIDSLGKEELLFHIARVLKIKIWVWPERLQTMHLLGFHDIFTTKTSMTRVRAVPRYSFSIDTLEGLNKIRPTIGIMPSGLSLLVKPQGSNRDLSSSSFVSHCAISKLKAEAASQSVERKLNEKPRPVETHHGHIYSVPYSDHSCYNEIEEFVKLVQPSNLKGIVSSSPCCIEPLYHFGSLLRANTKSETVLHNFERVKGKQVKAVSASSSDGSDNSAGTAKERRKTWKSNFLGVRIRRVSELRRLKRGAKLLETLLD